MHAPFSRYPRLASRYPRLASGTLVLAILVVSGIASAIPYGDRPPLPADELPANLYERAVPRGLPEIPREFSKEEFELGRALFFDPILSIDSIDLVRQLPRTGARLRELQASPRRRPGTAARNAPTVLNRIYAELHSWDGKAESLEAQTIIPMSNPIEMGLPLEEAFARLQAHDSYPALFLKAYGDDKVDEARLSRALTAFLSRLVIGDSPVDRFLSADDVDLTEDEKAGMWIFDSKGKCWKCHSGSNFSDEKFHNTGVGAELNQPEDGRFAVTGKNEDRGAFKTPTLRGVDLTAPYFHNGSEATLEDVVRFYSRGGNSNTHLSEDMEPLDLTRDEVRFLVAFLKALSRPAEAKNQLAPATPSGTGRTRF